jgi:hypothetical protein
MGCLPHLLEYDSELHFTRMISRAIKLHLGYNLRNGPTTEFYDIRRFKVFARTKDQWTSSENNCRPRRLQCGNEK